MVRDRSPQQNGDPLVGSQDRGSLVAWGIGEDELRVQSSGSVEALGIFYLGSGVFRTTRWVGFLLGIGLLLTTLSAPAAPDDEMSNMKRRQQGILTGMPFMAHITPRTFVDALGRKLFLAKTRSRV